MKDKRENTLNTWERLRKQEGRATDNTDQAWQQLWEHSDTVGSDFQPDVSAGLKRLKQRIHEGENEAKIIGLSPARRWLRACAAAAVIALVSWGVVANMPTTGNEATAWMEINTGQGEIREVILPDGSAITLNESTDLRYNANIDESEMREIRLSGEAFFDVDRRPSQPFIIHTQNADIEVLGTSFNVRAMEGETQTEVAVASGKVAVRGMDAEEIYLEAKDAVVVQDDYQIYTDGSSPLNSFAWRTGSVHFKAVQLSEALEIIGRFYRVNLNWDEKAIENCTITGDWGGESFAEVLTIIEGLTGLKTKKIDINTYQILGNCD